MAKWLYLAAALIAAAIAGLSVLPYGWAHLAVAAFMAASSVLTGYTGVNAAVREKGGSGK